MSDPLDPSALLLLLPTLLPRSTSSPLPHPTDLIAALVHTIHTSLGFRLTSSPSQVSQTSQSDPTSQGVAASSTNEQEVDDGASDTDTAVDNDEEPSTIENALSTGWNSRGEDTYILEYRHAQSSMVFRVRVGKMGGRVQIDATAEVIYLSARVDGH
jgi:hypothetical protein